MRKTHILGLKKVPFNPRYLPEEILIIKRYYPWLAQDALLLKLPMRTWERIVVKAGELNVSRAAGVTQAGFTETDFQCVLRVHACRGGNVLELKRALQRPVREVLLLLSILKAQGLLPSCQGTYPVRRQRKYAYLRDLVETHLSSLPAGLDGTQVRTHTLALVDTLMDKGWFHHRSIHTLLVTALISVAINQLTHTSGNPPPSLSTESALAKHRFRIRDALEP